MPCKRPSSADRERSSPAGPPKPVAEKLHLTDDMSRSLAGRSEPPLTDQERLLVGCMRVLARKVAARVRDLDEQTEVDLVDNEVRGVIESLGGCSAAFARETERYLRHAIAREQTL